MFERSISDRRNSGAACGPGTGAERARGRARRLFVPFTGQTHFEESNRQRDARHGCDRITSSRLRCATGCEEAVLLRPGRTSRGRPAGISDGQPMRFVVKASRRARGRATRSSPFIRAAPELKPKARTSAPRFNPLDDSVLGE